MHYGEIKFHDIANGLGIRVSLFVSGCTHHCKGCFNQETWDFCYGQKYTEEVEERILQECAKPYIRGLTLLGGEPFEKGNQESVCNLIRRFKSMYPNKDVWCYSGYTFDRDMIEGGRAFTQFTSQILSMIDYLVDGEFVEEEKNLSLKFRGSSNQRIINIPQSLKEGRTICYKDEELI